MRTCWLVPLVACSSSTTSNATDPFLGQYAVTAHREASAPAGQTIACSSAGTTAAAPPVIAIDADPTFLGEHGWVRLFTCATPESCTETQLAFEAGGPGLTGSYANVETASPCAMHAGLRTAELAGGVLHIEDRSWAKTQPSGCTSDQAIALTSSPDCATVAYWDATPR